MAISLQQVIILYNVSSKYAKIEEEVTIIPLSQTQICWNKSKYNDRTDTCDPVTNK